jgi:hypothetical protein
VHRTADERSPAMRAAGWLRAASPDELLPDDRPGTEDGEAPVHDDQVQER